MVKRAEQLRQHFDLHAWEIALKFDGQWYWSEQGGINTLAEVKLLTDYCKAIITFHHRALAECSAPVLDNALLHEFIHVIHAGTKLQFDSSLDVLLTALKQSLERGYHVAMERETTLLTRVARKSGN